MHIIQRYAFGQAERKNKRSTGPLYRDREIEKKEFCHFCVAVNRQLANHQVLQVHTDTQALVHIHNLLFGAVNAKRVPEPS